MRVHERTFLVQGAENELSLLVSKLVDEKGLTEIETVGCLLSIAQRWNMYTLRVERHGHSGKKADEA